MTFSIITCTHNSAKWLGQNIDSVSGQTSTDWEQIFIDGYSTDGTVEMIKKYQQRFPNKVKLFQTKPQGISQAMNQGIKEATGRYLIHLHSDDSFYDSGVLKDVDGFLSSGNYDWIYGKVNVVESLGDSKGTFPNKSLFQCASGKPFCKYLLKYYNYIPHQAVFIKKKVFASFGGFDEGISSAMDPDLWLRIKDKTKWSFFDRVISNYRLHSDSQSASAVNKEKTAGNWQAVQSRYLNVVEKIPAVLINWLAERKNNNYR